MIDRDWSARRPPSDRIALGDLADGSITVKPHQARLSILSRNALPERCGIAAHSARLGEALTAAGCLTNVIAQRGSPFEAQILPEGLTDRGLGELTTRLEQLGSEHVVLQYTPLSYQRRAWSIDREFVAAWRRISARWITSLIVHETYFRSWSSPASLISGTHQRRQLMAMAQGATHVFSASQTLLEEMADWELPRPAAWLPIGSNIDRVPGDGGVLRRQLGIEDGELILTLYSGGNSLKWMAAHVEAVDALLKAEGVRHRWLLLGGVPATWFRLSAPTITPGWLEPATLSAYLQLTNLFLVPHSAGISAKRGTLISALQHGLPIIGTYGPMTDPLWHDAEGVILASAHSAADFAAVTYRLCKDGAERLRCAQANERLYAQELTWEHIGARFLEGINRR
jgi:hypothetical protein